MKRRDINFGEWTDECRSRKGVCIGLDSTCRFYHEVCEKLDKCNANGRWQPKDLDLTDPPRFNEAQMEFWRGWYEIGARRARRNGTRIYLTLDNGDYFGSFESGCISEKIKHGLQEEEIIVLAELLGKETNENTKEYCT